MSSLFLSYAHEDKELLEDLKTHLTALRRERLITLWSDQAIPPGAEWETQVREALAEADMILLLVSPNFIASEYIWNVELQEAMRRHRDGSATVVPVIARPSQWEFTPIGSLQVLPTGANPVTLWPNVDAAWLDVTEGIRRLLTKTRPERVTLTIEVAPERVGPETLSRFSAVLREVSGDQSLLIRWVDKGSLVLSLDVSSSGRARLENLQSTDRLSKLLGYAVLQFEVGERPIHGGARVFESGDDKQVTGARRLRVEESGDDKQVTGARRLRVEADPGRILVAPSILSCDFGRLADEIRTVKSGGADWIHVDVMDGRFVPNITLGPVVIEAIRRVTDLPLDVHLMIEDPDRYLDAFAVAGADILTVHQEACRHLHRTVERVRELGMHPGVAVNPATPLVTVRDVLPVVDLLLVLSVNPGFGGQSYIASITGKLRRARMMLDELGSTAELQVEGGVDHGNMASLVEAGATVCVAGSAIFAHPGGAERGVRAIRAAALAS